MQNLSFLLKKGIFFSLVVYLFFQVSAYAQSKTNLEIFYLLVDSSVADIINKISEEDKRIEFEINLGESYKVFNNKIIAAVSSRNFDIINQGNGEFLKINYVIDNADVNYNDIFRDGFLGDFYLKRDIEISGNYVISAETSEAHTFNYTNIDTVKVDEIKSLENISFPFTQAEVPPEPFFSSLVEPLIAIGTAAVAIYLFFSVRSK